MSRPAQLALIGLVYALGVVIAVAGGNSLDAGRVLVGLGALMPVAASVHYANEYADYETDRLTERTAFSGGSGALHRVGLQRALAWQAAVTALAVGGVATVMAVLSGLAAGPVVVLVVIAGLGWQYSLEPLALVWRGLGEVTNVLLGALLLPLYGYAVVAGTVTVRPVVACLPFAMLVFVNLLETHWPDREADAVVGKTTLPVLWSPSRLRRVYAGWIGSYLVALWLLDGRVLPRSVTLSSLLVVPLLVWGLWRYTRREQPFPGVIAMVLLAVLQTGAWARLAFV